MYNNNYWNPETGDCPCSMIGSHGSYGPPQRGSFPVSKLWNRKAMLRNFKTEAKDFRFNRPKVDYFHG